MRERTPDLHGLQVRTLNALGLAILDGRRHRSGPPAGRRHRGHRASGRCGASSAVSSSRTRRRANTDPLAAWIEALSAVRLGLRDPADVEGEFGGDVDGLPDGGRPLPGRPAPTRHGSTSTSRSSAPSRCCWPSRTPAGRPAGVPAAARRRVPGPHPRPPAARPPAGRPRPGDVFGVGDDDQTIYGYTGATPEWLIGYDQLFPGAGHHPLEVNYRCPPAVVTAAGHAAGPQPPPGAPRRSAPPRPPRDGADGGPRRPASSARRRRGGGRHRRRRHRRSGRRAPPPDEVAVLTRVNATLAPVQVGAGATPGVPVRPAVDERWLDRTGVRAAIGLAAPGRRTPQRSGPPTCRQPPAARAGACRPRSSSGWPSSARLDGLGAWPAGCSGNGTPRRWPASPTTCASLAGRWPSTRRPSTCCGPCATASASTRPWTPSTVRSARRGGSAHVDDLDALVALARLRPDPATFPSWLRAARRWRGAGGGRRGRRSGPAVHRARGEGPGVAPRGASTTPARASSPIAWPPTSRRSAGSSTWPSPGPPARVTVVRRRGRPRRSWPSSRGDRRQAIDRAQPPARPRRSRLRPAVDGRQRRRAAGDADGRPPALVEALKAWRRERSRTRRRARLRGLPRRHPRGDRPAAPRTLVELARITGIGPTKLDRYGDDVLAVVDEAAGAAG